MRILDFGSLNIDHVYSLDHFVRAGETIASENYQRNEGGKGLNQAIALAKAGTETYMAGAVGEDGGFLRVFLTGNGVRTEYLKTVDVPTGHAIIQVNAEGQNSIILYGGANQAVAVEMIDETLAHFGKGDCVLLQNEISNVPYVIEKAKENGMYVVLNPSPATEAMKSWPLEKVDLFILNEIEGGDLTGETEPDRILDGLLARYPDSKVVLTLGENGSVFADRRVRIRQAAIPADAVDTTAAGDTFTGYFLTGYLNGRGIAVSLETASRAASIAVSRKGAGRSIPYAEELE